LSVFLRDAELRAEAGRFLHQREVFRRQGLQCELGLATLEDELALRRLQAHRLVCRHGAQNVDQLAGAHGGGEVAGVAIHFGGGADLDFQIAGGQLQGMAGFADHHVGQYRQGVTALDNACNGLQHRQQFVLGGLQNDHVFLFNGCRLMSASIFACFWVFFGLFLNL